MLTREEFIRLSLENNLFWLRIMKEHAIFIEASMPANERMIANDADRFKEQFEDLLAAAIRLANQSISQESLLSGIYRTRFTDEAERLVTHFTDINIDRQLTVDTTNIEPQTQYSPVTAEKEEQVVALNQSILTLMELFVQFKTSIYNNQVSCYMISFIYTGVLEHIIREANEYIGILTSLQNRETPVITLTPEDFHFWNHIMADHAKVIRGLLDPGEALLFEEANEFAKTYEALMQNPNVAPPLDNVLADTVSLSEFKAAITRGIIECKVRSLMLPLFTDHVLREANYYIRMLKMQ